MIDELRLHHSDKPFFHGGVKQYKTHTRAATLTNYLINYIHYKKNTKYNYHKKQPHTITIKYNTSNVQKQTIKYTINNYIVHVKI